MDSMPLYNKKLDVCFLQSFEQDEDDQYGQSYDDRNYAKEFTFGGYDNDGDSSGNILEQKPRIIMMGLRRLVLYFNFYLYMKLYSQKINNNYLSSGVGSPPSRK
jgi:hypothetical protein